MLKFEMKIYMLDDIQSNESLSIYLDNSLAGTINYSAPTTDLCGNSSFQDYGVTDFSITLNKSSGALSLLLKSTLSQNASFASFGIRDIKITVWLDTQSYTELYGYFTNSSIASWGITAPYNPTDLITVCADQSIFGGSGVFGKDTKFSKSFSSLPTHTMIVMNLTIFWIDSLDFINDTQNDYIEILANGISIYKKGPFFNISDPVASADTSNLCGKTDVNDYSYRINLSFSHSASNLDLVLQTGIDEDSSEESYGFREIVFTPLMCQSAAETCHLTAMEKAISCKSSAYFLSN